MAMPQGRTHVLATFSLSTRPLSVLQRAEAACRAGIDLVTMLFDNAFDDLAVIFINNSVERVANRLRKVIEVTEVPRSRLKLSIKIERNRNGAVKYFVIFHCRPRRKFYKLFIFNNPFRLICPAAAESRSRLRNRVNRNRE